MRNIAIIALLLACVSVAGNAGNRKEFDLMKQENMKMKDKAEIYLAGGCFWGTEHFLKQIRGVEQTEVGYANSQVPNPTYKEVCTGNTGAVKKQLRLFMIRANGRLGSTVRFVLSDDRSD